MKKLIFTSAFIGALTACGGTTTSQSGNITQQPATGPTTGGGTLGTGSGGGTPAPSGPSAPSYASLGFVATEDTTINVTSVIVIDADGVTDSFRAAPATNLDIRYDPVNRSVSVFTEGRAFDGSIDGESQIFFDNGAGFGSGSPNFVRVNTGAWSYAVDGNIDQNDGAYRHDIAVAGGQRFNHGFAGTASYAGNALGTIEVFRATDSQSIPFVAEGGLTLDFSGNLNGSAAIFGGYDLNPSLSNGASGSIIIADAIFEPGAGLNGTTQFHQAANAGISYQGDFIYADGSVTGLVAGPNAEEISGVMNLSHDGGTYDSSITGVIFGTR